MDKKKLSKLAAAGWTSGAAQDFLELSNEEAAYVELKVALAGALRNQRKEQHLSQMEAAKRLHSSQSRIAKMEAADPSVSVDLILRSLFSLGATQKEIIKAFSYKVAAKAH